jgi:hypothetical protein
MGSSVSRAPVCWRRRPSAHPTLEDAPPLLIQSLSPHRAPQLGGNGRCAAIAATFAAAVAFAADSVSPLAAGRLAVAAVAAAILIVAAASATFRAAVAAATAAAASLAAAAAAGALDGPCCCARFVRPARRLEALPGRRRRCCPARGPLQQRVEHARARQAHGCDAAAQQVAHYVRSQVALDLAAPACTKAQEGRRRGGGAVRRASGRRACRRQGRAAPLWCRWTPQR